MLRLRFLVNGRPGGTLRLSTHWFKGRGGIDIALNDVKGESQGHSPLHINCGVHIQPWFGSTSNHEEYCVKPHLPPANKSKQSAALHHCRDGFVVREKLDFRAVNGVEPYFSAKSRRIVTRAIPVGSACWVGGYIESLFFLLRSLSIQSFALVSLLPQVHDSL
jgi:hypothetical protein